MNNIKQCIAAALAVTLLIMCFGCTAKEPAPTEIKSLTFTDENGEYYYTDEEGSEVYIPQESINTDSGNAAPTGPDSVPAQNGRPADDNGESPTTPLLTTKKIDEVSGRTTTTRAGQTAESTAASGGASVSGTTTKVPSATASTSKTDSSGGGVSIVTTTARPSDSGSTSALKAKLTYLNDSDFTLKYNKNTNLSGYSLSAADAADFKSDPTEWASYTIAVSFANDTGSEISVYGLSIADNGKNGVYVDVNDSGVIGVGASNTTQQTTFFNVLVKNKGKDESVILKDIRNMDIFLCYTKSNSEDTSAAKLYATVN